jgi:predicted ATPase
MKNLALRTFQLKNFKAVRDSKVIKFTPLTVFIGNNGSGKSSLIEALETYQSIIVNGLDEAMNRWRGYEYIRNLAVSHTVRKTELERHGETNPIEFNIGLYIKLKMVINVASGRNELFIQEETLSNKKSLLVRRNADGSVYDPEQGKTTHKGACEDGISIISRTPSVTEKTDFEAYNEFDAISSWQFLSLAPDAMTSPMPQKRTGGRAKLNKDGSNIAEYLLDIIRRERSVFDGILETLQFILPYARDLQPALTSELERNVYLQLTEADFKVPGWLLSTGTMRLVALLALLRHPTPPPLIVIEEIENGLDPRTIHLIVNEIRRVIESGKSQIIITTHSPYLLDLLHISQIVLVERDEAGQPIFSRPDGKESLGEWTKKFSPGKLYTMGQLSRRSGE